MRAKKCFFLKYSRVSAREKKLRQSRVSEREKKLEHSKGSVHEKKRAQQCKCEEKYGHGTISGNRKDGTARSMVRAVGVLVGYCQI